MKFKICTWGLALGLLLSVAADAWAGTIFVSAAARGANTGQSWADAFTDLQAALAAAQSGDEIWVAAGAYKPTSSTDRTISFVMKTGVDLYGGFAGTEDTREARDWKAHETILSGDIGKQGDATDNTYHVVVGADQATIDGFTITGGPIRGILEDSGGGLVNQFVSPAIANCTFSGNTGGGMYNSRSSPKITNCIFSVNMAYYMHSAGGMTNQDSTPTVTGCTFFNNISFGPTGGAMLNINSSPTVSNCVFNGNSCIQGGGMDNENSSPLVINCLFYGNHSASGGGMYNDFTSAPMVTNCTFSGNSSTDNGDGIYNATSLSPVFLNCIFWGDNMWVDNQMVGSEVYSSPKGSPIFRYCAIQGCGGSGAQWDSSLGTDGGGNIAADPAFVDAAHPAGPDGLWFTADDGLALKAGSPCIDAGTSDGAPQADILGHARVGLPDLGAYEYFVHSAAGNWALYQ